MIGSYDLSGVPLQSIELIFVRQRWQMTEGVPVEVENIGTFRVSSKTIYKDDEEVIVAYSPAVSTCFREVSDGVD
jgi:hypothetical protein